MGRLKTVENVIYKSPTLFYDLNNLSTLSSTGIFVIFKIIDKVRLIFKCYNHNYLVASIVGFCLKRNFPITE
jgi:hypothetical protein